MTVVSNLEINMKTYFAIDVVDDEHHFKTAEMVIRLAKENNILFRRIEVLDKIYVAGKEFYRFRSDLASGEVLTRLLFKGRELIIWNGSAYELLRGAKKIRIGSSTLHQTPRPGIVPLILKGPKIVGWESQFVKSDGKTEKQVVNNPTQSAIKP